MTFSLYLAYLKLKLRERPYLVSALLAILLFSLSGEFAYAASDCLSKVPAWLERSKALIQEPITWLKWGSAVAAGLFITFGGIKLKAARGRADKIEEAMKMIYWTIGAGVVVFGGTSIGEWYVSKLCVA